MPDLKISQLPVATTPLAGTELVPIVQGGVTDRTTVEAFLTSTVPSGTANGVLYLNGSKVATSGSALTFDGTNLGVGGASSGPRMQARGTINNEALISSLRTDLGVETALGSDGGLTAGFVRTISNHPLVFGINNSEQMRLTSTGLGIGTSNTGNGRLNVQAGTSVTGNSGFFTNLDGTNNPYVQIQHSSAGTKLFAASSSGGAASNLTLATPGGSAVLDSSGNLGLGVTPSAWDSGYKAFDFNTTATMHATATTMWLGNNFFVNSGGSSIYKTSTFATSYRQDNAGNHVWFTAPSGTAGTAISFTQALTLDASGNLLLGGTSAGASSAASLTIFNGTAPTGSVTNGIILYAEDVSSSSELKVRDEAGNVTTLSPHNFSLIPEGPSEDMAWAYYSEKGGKRINVDMLKLARMVEKLTGEKLVYES